MTLQSALYVGEVRHTRQRPRRHAFRYRLFLLYLDLDELDDVFHGRWLWSCNRTNIVSFQERDYLPSAPGTRLAERARAVVADHLGRRPQGPVRLLGHARHFGHIFNPVSFYYCFTPDGSTLDAIIAEVHNTPWNERHCYVLDARTGDGDQGRYHFRVAKTFHVSPFLAMDYVYDWHLTLPAERLHVALSNERAGRRDFTAALDLQRRPLSGPQLAGALARHPAITAKVTAAIYWQALRLWLKGVPVQPHPGDPAG